MPRLAHFLFPSIISRIVDKTAIINNNTSNSNNNNKNNSNNNDNINNNNNNDYNQDHYLDLAMHPHLINGHNLANQSNDLLVAAVSPYLLFLQGLLLAHVSLIPAHTPMFLDEIKYVNILFERCQSLLSKRGSVSDYYFMYLLLQLISTISMASPVTAKYFNLKYRDFIEQISTKFKK